MANSEYDKHVRTQRQLFRDYVDAFASKCGKRVFDDLAVEFSDELSYSKGDPYETAYNEGARSVVLHIRRCIDISKNPKLFEDLVSDGSDEEED